MPYDLGTTIRDIHAVADVTPACLWCSRACLWFGRRAALISKKSSLSPNLILNFTSFAFLLKKWTAHKTGSTTLMLGKERRLPSAHILKVKVGRGHQSGTRDRDTGRRRAVDKRKRQESLFDENGSEDVGKRKKKKDKITKRRKSDKNQSKTHRCGSGSGERERGRLGKKSRKADQGTDQSVQKKKKKQKKSGRGREVDETGRRVEQSWSSDENHLAQEQEEDQDVESELMDAPGDVTRRNIKSKISDQEAAALSPGSKMKAFLHANEESSSDEQDRSRSPTSTTTSSEDSTSRTSSSQSRLLPEKESTKVDAKKRKSYKKLASSRSSRSGTCSKESSRTARPGDEGEQPCLPVGKYSASSSAKRRKKSASSHSGDDVCDRRSRKANKRKERSSKRTRKRPASVLGAESASAEIEDRTPTASSEVERKNGRNTARTTTVASTDPDLKVNKAATARKRTASRSCVDEHQKKLLLPPPSSGGASSASSSSGQSKSSATSSASNWSSSTWSDSSPSSSLTSSSDTEDEDCPSISSSSSDAIRSRSRTSSTCIQEKTPIPIQFVMQNTHELQCLSCKKWRG